MDSDIDSVVLKLVKKLSPRRNVPSFLICLEDNLAVTFSCWVLTSVYFWAAKLYLY